MNPFPADPHHDEGPLPEPPGLSWPPFALLWRGLALGGVSLVLARWAIGSVRTSVLLAPLALVLLAGAGIAAWAGTIQLTGGVRHDDHPWI